MSRGEINHPHFGDKLLGISVCDRIQLINDPHPPRPPLSVGYIPPQVPPEDRNVPAEDVMIHVEDILCLSLYSTGKDASEVAALCQPGQVIPVVQSM